MDGDVIRTNLRRLVTADGRSARKISLLAGMSESFLKHVFRGNSQDPGYHALKEVARVLGVPVSAITGSQDSVPPPLQSQPSKLVEDQTMLQLLAFWEAIPEDERTYLLEIIRRSALGR